MVNMSNFFSSWFANQDERKFGTLFRYFVESVGGPEQGHRRCLADVTNRGLITSATQANLPIDFLYRSPNTLLRNKQTPCITNWPFDFSTVCLPDWLTMSEQTVLRTNWLSNYLTGPNWPTVDLRWAVVVVVVVGTYTAPTSIPRGIPMYMGYFSSYHTSSSVPHGISLNAR